MEIVKHAFKFTCGFTRLFAHRFLDVALCCGNLIRRLRCFAELTDALYFGLVNRLKQPGDFILQCQHFMFSQIKAAQDHARQPCESGQTEFSIVNFTHDLAVGNAIMEVKISCQHITGIFLGVEAVIPVQ